MWRSVLLLLLLPAGDVLGYSPVRPKRHDVQSWNRMFVLDVDPGAQRLTVFAADKRDKPLWSFKRRVWQEKHFLSNDGKVVAVVTWRFVPADSLGDGVCVEFWDQTGKIREYPFAELCPHPAHCFFDGPFLWREWFSEAEGDGATLRVCTTDEYEYVFAMDDGRILKTARVGLPWWFGWALLSLGLGGIVWFVIRRRRRRAVQLDADV